MRKTFCYLLPKKTKCLPAFKENRIIPLPENERRTKAGEKKEKYYRSAWVERRRYWLLCLVPATTLTAPPLILVGWPAWACGMRCLTLAPGSPGSGSALPSSAITAHFCMGRVILFAGSTVRGSP